ncbi:hypothetical protein C9374_007159 [Naegleria lovaniensis]|uniref:MPN domain-containing protein n=1 Tax=Naegleria lovaniensis TaxID=51637 RepID=A0AA88H319_NAELO|nr:uncharacterized protein C9374_007159 [Naegleria lovaniensis]KAG2393628.1 hypothetical protein C9374_007159 [Naegleria lovaniensis]
MSQTKPSAASTITQAQTIVDTQTVEFDKDFISKMENAPHVSEVSIDAMVLLKMMNHCTEKVPIQVAGQLLGLDNGGVLEITNCFPFPSYSDNLTEEERSDQDEKYQIEMLQGLSDVNVDNNTVGWYQSTYMDSFMNATTIANQYQYQRTLGNKRCIHLVFDPLRTRRGELFIKAYRLSDKFIDAVKMAYLQQNELSTMKKKYDIKNKNKKEDIEVLTEKANLPESIEKIQLTQEILAKLNLSDKDIFDELPIQIHNYALVQAFLLDFENDEPSHLLAGYDSLDMANTQFLTRGLESLIEYADGLSHENHRYQTYQKKLAQQKQYVAKKKDRTQEEQEFMLKSVQQPDQLNYLMIANQLGNACDQMRAFSSQSLNLSKIAEIAMKKE